MKKLLSTLIVIACVFWLGVPVAAQSCMTAVCNAASANESDVIAAMPSSSNTNATVVVNIPAQTASWASDFVYTIPASITSLTIQGATTITWSGTAGTSSWNYSANDLTIIQDADSSNNSLITINTRTDGGAPSSHFTFSGITLEETTGATKYAGEIAINGNSQNMRITGWHITGTGKQDEWFRFGGHVIGVVDHNAGDENPNTSNGDNYFQAFDPVDDTIGLGDGSWNKGTEWGSLNALYIESNYIKGGAGDDCNWGARFVMRYNTLDSNYVPIQTHGTKSSGGNQRGCNRYEAYNNYIVNTTGTTEVSGASGAKGGTALVFNNTLATSAAYRFFEASTDRNGGDTSANEVATPNGWGYCGTATVNPQPPNQGVANGIGSNWDGNQTTAGGYPCLDGLGRGQDALALNGQAFPNRGQSGCTVGTNCVPFWPQQYLEPIYMWNNSVGAATYTLITTNATNNVDYYYDAAAQGASFTGASGTGSGSLSARPATCTAGPGGTYGASPTGSYGVAYFATDANSGNGELYVCTATNTWTAIYQPYAYPHPLVSGVSTTPTGPSPTAPTMLISTSN